MRFFATLAGSEKPVVVEIESKGPGRFSLTLDGRRHDVDAHLLPHGAVSLILDGQSHSVEFEEHADEVAVWVAGCLRRVDVVDERRLRLRQAGGSLSVEGRQVVTAPMPGKVVKILVRPDEEVRVGQGLVVVEAMKMENELKSPKAGKVAAVFVTEGNLVEKDAKLVAVE